MANGFSSLDSFPGAATSLGLGDQLGQQVQGETDEERKRRLKLQGFGDPAQTDTGSGSIFGGLASSQLFGSYAR